MKTTAPIQFTLHMISITLLFTSCVSYKSITQTGPAGSQLKISAPLTSGDVVRITMKSGEKIQKLKVKEIDALKISGVQFVETTAKWIHVDKSIQVADIKEIKKRKFSPGKTAGVVVIGVSIPLLIVALTFHPLSGGLGWGHP